ncbi:hypothetical protein, partial [Burkholderia pseudomallei]|uniref:hypothetical protein n=1 Tax=Burkholderia pseudomallei TaxID=28450 RepID=UPI001CA569EB
GGSEVCIRARCAPAAAASAGAARIAIAPPPPEIRGRIPSTRNAPVFVCFFNSHGGFFRQFRYFARVRSTPRRIFAAILAFVARATNARIAAKMRRGVERTRAKYRNWRKNPPCELKKQTKTGAFRVDGIRPRISGGGGAIAIRAAPAEAAAAGAHLALIHTSEPP